VIVVYGNPHTIMSWLKSSLPARLLKKLKSLLKKRKGRAGKDEGGALYFHLHPLEWWDRFTDVADIAILPWRSFSSNTQKKLVPNNRIGGKMFGVLFRLEERFPGFFVRHFQYPMIVLTKKGL
jgi:hypothetical protein